MRQERLARASFEVRIGLADTRGAAWALARHGGGIAAPGESLAALEALPVAGLRLDQDTGIALQRLGLRTIGALAGAPRAPLARRFGPGLLKRLDQATGVQPEAIIPLADPPHYAARLTLPEPIGLTADVMLAALAVLAGTMTLLWTAGVRMLHQAQAASPFQRPPPFFAPLGAITLSIKFCTQCGARAAAADRFCRICGTSWRVAP